MDYCKLGCRENALLLTREEDLFESISVDVNNIKEELVFLPERGVRGFREHYLLPKKNIEDLKRVSQKIKDRKRIRKCNDLLLRVVTKTVEFSIMIFSLISCISFLSDSNKSEETMPLKYFLIFSGWTAVTWLRFFQEKSSLDSLEQSQRRLELYKINFELLAEVNALLLSRLDENLISRRKVSIEVKSRSVRFEDVDTSSIDEGDVDEPHPHSGNSSECY